MLNFATRLALSPLLLAQGLSVRANAVRLPEAAGPRTGRLGSGPKLSLLILGDSSAAGVGVDHQNDALAGQLAVLLANHFTLDWQLVAKTGATTRTALQWLETHPPAPIDIVVTALGVNDVTHAVPYPLWLRQQNRMFARINTLFAPRRVYVSGVPPLGDFPILPQPLRWSLGTQARRFDAGLARLTEMSARLSHIPFNSPLVPSQMAQDGFHPGPEIYTLWAKEMASRILSDWPLDLET
ncbi:SGNH/GDSL hydrolase family protein [Sulfitobacter sp.]|uniref:SGNH/GDSL hydrolase family protein n=1 Tax=Sulfitobacter sp. TaxID=1903071 RepID=UPI003F6B0B70